MKLLEFPGTKYFDISWVDDKYSLSYLMYIHNEKLYEYGAFVMLFVIQRNNGLKGIKSDLRIILYKDNRDTEYQNHIRAILNNQGVTS